MLSEGERGGAHFPPGCQSEAVELLPSFLSPSISGGWTSSFMRKRKKTSSLALFPHFPLSQSVRALNTPAESVSTFVPFMLMASHIHFGPLGEADVGATSPQQVLSNADLRCIRCQSSHV